MITDGFVNTKNYFSRQVSIIFYFFYRIRPKRADMAGRLRAFRSPVQVFASSPPARKKGMTNVMPFRVLVEMIRLELTPYTLRTYRSTG